MKDDCSELIRPRSDVGDLIVKESSPRFTSITRSFLSSATSKELKCPRCGSLLNFANGVEWIGPDSFTCKSCEQLINIALIQRALRELGVD